MKKLFDKFLLLFIALVIVFGVAACSDNGEFTLEATANVAVGQTRKLTLVNTTQEKTVTWESDDSTIATVSRTGTVTGVKAGTVIISASAGSFYGESTVTVSAEAADQFELEATATVAVGKTKKLTLLNTTGQTSVTWDSLDKTVATVSSTGTVTGLKVGSTTITAVAGTYSDECELTVTADDVDPNVIPASGEITTVAHLRSIASKLTMLTRSYYLANDIDFEGGEMETIGTWGGAAYSGTFDGKGFAIKNVKFTGGTSKKNTNQDNATFGNAFVSVLTGTVKNLNLINITAEGNGFCAAIAAENSGTIENCFVGGNTTKISCTNGWDWWVPGGGLVSINGKNGTISNCLYSAPAVTGGFALVGWNIGSTTHCYAARGNFPVEANDTNLIIVEGGQIKAAAGDEPALNAGPSSCAFLTESQLIVPASYVGFSADYWEMSAGKMAYLKGAGERVWAAI